MAVLLLSACNPGNADEGKNTESSREIVVASVTEPDSVDVHKTSSIGDPTAAAYLSFFNMDDEGNTIPGAIKDYEVAEDGKVITFKLEEGLTFHSGEPFNAEALKSSMDRFLENSPFYDNAGAITDVTVVDEYSIKVTWSEPYAPFFSNAVSP